MGYCVTQESCRNFLIKKSNKGKVLQAIKDLAGKETIADASGRHFSWVDPNYEKAKTLGDAFSKWRWQIETNKVGDVINLQFEGEKLGDDYVLMCAIAPFVTSGDIEMRGEDGFMWRWVFKDKKCHELLGRVVYDDLPPNRRP